MPIREANFRAAHAISQTGGLYNREPTGSRVLVIGGGTERLLMRATAKLEMVPPASFWCRPVKCRVGSHAVRTISP
jgi:hypothetical protein